MTQDNIAENIPEPADNKTEIDPPATEEPSAASVIEGLQAEMVALKDKMLRAAAEAENTRRRAQKEIEDVQKYAVSSFAKDLVGVAENLQRALSSLPADVQDPAVKNLRLGVEMTLQELLSAFERQNIRRIDPTGQKFDHNFHQSIAQIETPDAEAGIVVQVVQAGYVIHDRLLRPAMVGVSKGSAPKQVDTTA